MGQWDSWPVGQWDSGTVIALARSDQSVISNIYRTIRACPCCRARERLVSPHLRKWYRAIELSSCLSTERLRPLLPCCGQKEKENFPNLVHGPTASQSRRGGDFPTGIQTVKIINPGEAFYSPFHPFHPSHLRCRRRSGAPGQNQ